MKASRFATGPIIFLFIIGAGLALPGCRSEIEAPEPEAVPLFTGVTVHFTPEDSARFDSPFASARDNGRIMATYREMPEAGGPAAWSLNFKVSPIRKDIRNVHDRWDRAGSIRLVKPGMAPVELARFMTAYGGVIEHEADVSRYAPLFVGHCEFEVFIDTWVSPAWIVDADLVRESMSHGIPSAPAWGLGALFPNGGLNAENPEASVRVEIPRGLRRVSLSLLVSGHCTDGRDADEFITKDNVILIGGKEVHRWRPWRDDCRDFRAVNPYCAKWSDGSWSSDYPRSGWCPGDVVDPEILDLSAWLTPGPHDLVWRVEDIRPRDAEGNHGYWRISAGLSGWR